MLAGDCIFVCIANKVDMEVAGDRVVSQAEARAWAESNDMSYYETSSKWEKDLVQTEEVCGISKIFDDVLDRLMIKTQGQKLKPTSRPPKGKCFCC